MKSHELRKIIKEEIQSVITEQQLLREFWEVAGAVTLGILGSIAAVKGLGVLRNIVGIGLENLVDYLRPIAKRAEEAKELKNAQKIAQKFAGDQQLKDMFAELENYPYSPDMNSKQIYARQKASKKIQNYVESKLTPEEKRYVYDITKGMRNKQIEI